MDEEVRRINLGSIPDMSSGGAEADEILSPEGAVLEFVQTLGLVETDEMRHLRNGIGTLEEDETFFKAFIDYDNRGRGICDLIHDKSERQRAQFGLIMASALLYLEGKRPDDAREMYEQAVMFAKNAKGYEEIQVRLQEIGQPIFHPSLDEKESGE